MPDGSDASAWPRGPTPVGAVVPFLPTRPEVINPTVDRLTAPVLDGLAEFLRRFADPVSP